MQPQRHGSTPRFAVHRGVLWVALLAVIMILVPVPVGAILGSEASAVVTGIIALVAGIVAMILAFRWVWSGQGLL